MDAWRTESTDEPLGQLSATGLPQRRHLGGNRRAGQPDDLRPDFPPSIVQAHNAVVQAQASGPPRTHKSRPKPPDTLEPEHHRKFCLHRGPEADPGSLQRESYLGEWMLAILDRRDSPGGGDRPRDCPDVASRAATREWSSPTAFGRTCHPLAYQRARSGRRRTHRSRRIARHAGSRTTTSASAVWRSPTARAAPSSCRCRRQRYGARWRAARPSSRARRPLWRTRRGRSGSGRERPAPAGGVP
jgi:hypothetical protein